MKAVPSEVVRIRWFAWSMEMLVLVSGSKTSAQGVGIGTTTPHPSARLEIMDTQRGLLIPRLTVAQRDSIIHPAHALLIFNIDNFCLEVYDSFTHRWLAVSCPRACNPCDSCRLPVIDSLTGPAAPCWADTVEYIVWGNHYTTVAWNPPTEWLDLGGFDTARFVASSPGWLKVSLCNECGCVAAQLLVQIDNAPTLTGIVQQPANPVCPADTVILRAIGTGLVNTWSWTLPPEWIAFGPAHLDSIRLQGPPGAIDTVWITACNGCGCDSAYVILQVQNVSLSVSIAGPSFACTTDTMVWKAPATGASSWTWSYPPSWTLIAQTGDSIMLIPDTSDGFLAVMVSDGCALGADTLWVRADTCRRFCIAIGGPDDDHAMSMIQTGDEGYVLAGYTRSYGQGSYDLYVLKLDKNGHLQWTRTIGGPNLDYGYSLIQTIDRGVAIAGYTNSYGQGGYDAYVVKLDSIGNLLWTRTIGDTNWNVAYSLVQTSDAGFAIAGYTWQGVYDVFVAKLDSAGHIQWTRSIGGSQHDRGHAIIQTSDGGYAIVGVTMSFGAGDEDVYVFKLDSSGNLQWARSIGGPNQDIGRAIIQTFDRGYAIVGYTTSYGQGNWDVYVVKLDSSGNLQWTRTVGGPSWDYGYAIVQTSDGGLLIAGETSSYGAGSFDIYVIKLDSTGHLLWTKTIGGPGADRGYAILQSRQGSYAIAGYTTSYGQGNNDIYVVLLDPNVHLGACPGGCTTGSGGLTGSGGAISAGGVPGTPAITTNGGGIPSTGGLWTDICQ